MKHRGNTVILVIIVMSTLSVFVFSLASKAIREKRMSKISLEYTNSSISIKSYQKVLDKRLEREIKGLFYNYLEEVQKYQVSKLGDEDSKGAELLGISSISQLNSKINQDYLKSFFRSDVEDFEIYIREYDHRTQDGEISYLLEIENKGEKISKNAFYVIKNPDISKEDRQKIYTGQFDTLWNMKKDKILMRRFNP